MLPVVDFPDSGLINQFGDYKHLRPLRYSSQLRYSLGGDKGRLEADWQHGVATQIIPRKYSMLSQQPDIL